MEKRFINRLDKEELTAELEFRGIIVPSTQSIDNLRKQLRKALKFEEVGASFSPKVSRAPAEEYAICEKKIKQVQLKLESSDESVVKQFRCKAEAKLTHALVRLSRIQATPDQDLAAKLVDLVVVGNELLDIVRAPGQTAHQKPLTGATDDQRSDSGSSSSSYASDRRTILSSETSSESSSGREKSARSQKQKKKKIKKPVARQLFDSEDEAPRSRSYKSYFRRTPVSNWNLKFTGQDSPMSIRRFFVEVHDFRKANQMSKQDLLREAKFLFEGQALEVFRSCCRSCSDWNDLEARITLAFTDPSYDRVLKREIEDRMQGNDEPILVYLSKMDNLFDLLSHPLSEKEKLEIVKSNILPEYQIALSLHHYGSLKQLESLLIKLEESRSRTLARGRLQSGHVEPSLQHISKKDFKSQPKRSDVYLAAMESPAPSQVNSESMEKKKKEFYCYTCKTPGVIRPRCPNCKARKSENHEAEGQNSGTPPATPQ